MALSPPSRGRGSKPVGAVVGDGWYEVASFTGAWIETMGRSKYIVA